MKNLLFVCLVIVFGNACRLLIGAELSVVVIDALQQIAGAGLMNFTNEVMK